MSTDQNYKNYVLVTIFRAGTLPKSAESELSKIVEDIGGKLNKEVEHFGERDLSFPIEGEDKGVYLRAAISLASNVLPNLRDELRLEKKILRFLILKG